MKTLILINGLPRSGKDTTADFIVKNTNAVKLSFADPLKKIIARTFDISLDDLNTYKNNPNDYGVEIKSSSDNQSECTDNQSECTDNQSECTERVIKRTNFREILQLFGTEGMKPEFSEYVWSDLLYKKVLSTNANLFVASDFRFLSEYRPQPDIRIVKMLILDDRKLPTEGHASDVELYQNSFRFDYIIKNTGTLDELEKNINNIINEIQESKC